MNRDITPRKDLPKKPRIHYRLYSFTNMYLSPIQSGIQTAHIVSNLLSQCHEDDDIDETYSDMKDMWAMFDKTIIVCNGGNSKSLEDLFQFFIDIDIKLPYTIFHEDEESLNGALTAVGVLVPENLYDAKYMEHPDKPEDIDKQDKYALDSYRFKFGKALLEYDEDTPEFKFIQKIRSFRLA